MAKKNDISLLSSEWTQPPKDPKEKPKVKPKPKKEEPVRWKGVDAFSPDPGQQETMHCKACGSKMKVKRNAFGSTAMYGSPRKHDHFYCAHSGTDWHNQVVRLSQDIERTHSAAVEKLMRKEMKQIIATRRATMKVSILW